MGSPPHILPPWVAAKFTHLVEVDCTWCNREIYTLTAWKILREETTCANWAFTGQQYGRSEDLKGTEVGFMVPYFQVL